MSWWARVVDGVVAEPAVDLPAGAQPSQYYPSSLPGTWEASADGTPQSGWTYSAGTYTAPSATLTLAEQAFSLLAGGLALTSTSDSDLNATYPADPTTQGQITAEVTSILLNSTFTNGAGTLAWVDITGAAHTFDLTHFKAFATAMAAFVSGCAQCVSGTASQLPSASVNIA